MSKLAARFDSAEPPCFVHSANTGQVLRHRRNDGAVWHSSRGSAVVR